METPTFDDMDPKTLIRKTLVRLVFVISGMIVAIAADAQDPAVDSLKNLLSGRIPDSARVKTLNEIGVSFIGYNGDTALAYLNRASKLAAQTEDRSGLAKNLNYMGRYYQSLDQHYKALDFFLQSLAVTDYYDQSRVAAVTHYDLANLYQLIANYTGPDEMHRQRVSHLRMAIAIIKPIVKPDDELAILIGASYLRIGQAFMTGIKTHNLDSAEYYLNLGLEEGKRLGSSDLEALFYQDMANVSFLRSDFKKAIMFAHKAKGFSNFEMLLGKFHGWNHNLDSASYWLNIFSNNNAPTTKGLYYSVMGEVYEKNNRYRDAINYYQKFLELSKKESSFSNIVDANNRLANCYQVMGDTRNALQYFQRYQGLKDSLASESTLVRFAQLNSQRESEFQQARIDKLSGEAEIKDLVISRNRTRQLATGIVLLLMSAAAVLAWRQNGLIKKARAQQAKAFHEVDELKSRFFANISHEFRTPLTLLLGPLEKRLAAATSTNDKFELDAMYRSTTRLLDLVNQMLDLSRIESGTLKMRIKFQDLNLLVQSISSQFTSIAELRKINFEVLLLSQVDVWIDPDKVEKIVANLLSNAFKFTGNGGNISVIVAREDGFAKIEVADSGIGIPGKDINKIFDRFYQVDQRDVRSIDGAGIGLSLVRELIELHHGTIKVESVPGQGSVFTIKLPLGKAHFDAGTIIPPLESDDIGRSPGPALPAGERPIVLVAEDNSDLRKFVVDILSENYSVLEAASGDVALEFAVERLPDLVLTDVMMPKVDGIDLCRQLKHNEKTSHIPVIILTAKVDLQSKLEGLKTGADDYLPKPFHIEELLTRVANLVASRKLLRSKFASSIALRPSDITVESVEDRFTRNIIEAIELHIADPLFGVEQLADELAMSTSQLTRKLKAVAGQTPNEVIRSIRLERASSLLKQRSGTVADIAYQVGFNNLSYFAKCFKEKFGEAPSSVLKNS